MIRRRFYKYLLNKYLDDCKTILDVGSGVGVFYDQAIVKGKNVTGIEIEDSYIRDNIIKKDFFELENKFDGIFLSQFIEHHDSYKVMEKVEKLCLKKVIIIAPKPTFSFWNNPEHKRPHTAKSLSRLMQLYGLKTIWKSNLGFFSSCICIGEKK